MGQKVDTFAYLMLRHYNKVLIALFFVKVILILIKLILPDLLSQELSASVDKFDISQVEEATSFLY